jgi:hypothetical protein
MWYFAYGSNLNIRAVTDWCRHYGHRAPVMKNGQAAALDNYRLCFPIFSEYWGGAEPLDNIATGAAIGR